MINSLKALRQNGQLSLVIDAWKFLRAVNPPVAGIESYLTNVSALLNDYGNELGKKGDFDSALDYFSLSLRASDKHAPVILNNAAGFLKDSGRLQDAIATYQRAMTLNPNFEPAQDGLLLSLHYKMIAAEKLVAEHKAWGEKHRLHSTSQNYANDRDPDRPLKIGFVSGDFGIHPVGMFLISYLENIDRTQYACYCYATTMRDDQLTARLRGAAAHWLNVHYMSTNQLFEKIRADQIDILIDLSGHTADNRLAVFALKPAPLQLSWIGYPGENGLPVMDYVIGDRFVLPQQKSNTTHPKPLHLPDSFICFMPPSDSPPVTALPATVPGDVTFGCFHNPAKCGEEVIKLWARVLHTLPRAKLLFKYKGFGNSSTQHLFRTRFGSAGIEPSRLEFQGESSFAAMFDAIGQVDLALDPFPFCGGLMTCLTLWMGVPVITLPGETFASRQGLSFLSTLSITETIAASPEDYHDKAVSLAHDLKTLSKLRKTLRPAMKNSSLCDGIKAARSLQNLLRQIWQDWCVPGHDHKV